VPSYSAPSRRLFCHLHRDGFQKEEEEEEGEEVEEEEERW
jgi:hypothetical protein